MMFAIDEGKRTDKDVCKIVSKREVIFADGMEEILWAGRNKYGNWVLAVSVDEDRESKIDRHFAVHVLDWMYNAFRRGEYTYRHFMQGMNQVYVVDTRWDTDEETVYELRFNEIPEDYLPSKDSFCPGAEPTKEAREHMKEDYDEWDEETEDIGR